MRFQNNNYESSQRNIDIKLVHFQNNEKELNHGRNAENKSVIIIPKVSIRFPVDKCSTSDNDIKININTDSVNINLEKKNRPSSSKSNHNNNSNFFRKFNILPLFNRNFISYKNKERNDSLNKFKINETCLICDEKLNEKEKENNFIECHHAFCSDCYYNYLKGNIDSNNIISIKCPQNECQQILYNNFIEKMLINDIPLLDKYKKLVNRRQLILNPNIQLCPYPDCESYAKKGKNKYVSCVHNNHKFCLNCLKSWHEQKRCENKNILEEKFEQWRNSNRVKRCPRCKYFIEKNFGCNHITCFNCEYQFCWLCLNEYNSIHYKKGTCSGLQFSRFECLSNKIILYLRRILLIISKSIAFIFLFYISLIYIIYAKLYNEFTEKDDNLSILWGLAGIFACFPFLAILLSISAILAILMIFIWPLQDKIYELICD